MNATHGKHIPARAQDANPSRKSTPKPLHFPLIPRPRVSSQLACFMSALSSSKSPRFRGCPKSGQPQISEVAREPIHSKEASPFCGNMACLAAFLVTRDWSMLEAAAWCSWNP